MIRSCLKLKSEIAPFLVQEKVMLTGSILLMPLYGIFYLVMASARILHEDYVQQKIEEQGRSTVHSLISLAENVYGVGFFGLFALILSGHKVFSILVIVAAYIIAVCFLLGVMYYRSRKQDSNATRLY